MVRKLCNGKTMTDYGCMLRGYSRNVVNAILECPENGKFIPMLAMTYARKSVEVHVKHAERAAGESKYSVMKLIALQYDLLTGTSTFPLRMLTFFGFGVGAFGVLFGLYVFIRSQIDKDWGAFGTFAMFAVVFVLMGMQFASMGLLGEYIGKIHLNSRARPQFFIESIHRKNNTQPKEQE
jgi:undecaprenyl-phosphate 4-deoxy-4-formamido-L-arabinose transferase